jgi:hypothetical protein
MRTLAMRRIFQAAEDEQDTASRGTRRTGVIPNAGMELERR